MRRFLPVVVLIVGCATAAPAQAVAPSSVSLPNTPSPEVEPNETSATATPFAASGRMRGMIAPNADVDIYSFTAAAGERVHAATMTNASASGTVDTTLVLLASDGTTAIETDADDGTFGGGTSSSIAGALVPADGTYYLSVRHPGNTAQVRPYDLYLTTRSGAPVAETEDNALATPQALPAGGHASGALSAAADVDAYSFALNAGDTVFVSLDLDPERDTITWDGRLGLGTFGSGATSVLRITDNNVTSPNSEAFFMTVKSSGTFVAEVSAAAATFGTYNLSVAVVPGVTSSCRVYDSSAPVVIPAGPGMVTSAIAVPDDVVMGRVALQLDVTHMFMGDLDISLQTPAGNEIVPLSDVGGSTVGGPDTKLDVLLDSSAGLAPAFPRTENQMLQPEGTGGKLSWLEGEQSGGTWTLVVRDDATGDSGTLTGWRLVLCEADPPPSGTTSLYSTSFDADDGGFTHSGTADEWERGLPAFAPITTCAGGSAACWKTDLDNTYDASSSQDLVSPPIALGSHQNVLLTWMHRYQIETANFDHYFVEVREVGVPGSERRVFEWTGPTMTMAVGNPATTIQQSAGWGVVPVDISSFAGKTVEVRFHLDSDASIHLTGAAVDNVEVLGYDGTPPDTSIDSGPTGATGDSTPTFTFSSTEGGSTFECRVDSASFAACTSPHTTAQLANGAHTFEVRASDSSGNTDASPASRSFAVVPATGGGGDTTAPGIRLSGARTQKAGKTVLVVVTATTENMFATATGTVVVPGASKVFRLRAVRNRAVANGARSRLRLKVPKKAQKAIKRALRRRKKVTARITVSARDAAGNRASAKRRVKLRR